MPLREQNDGLKTHSNWLQATGYSAKSVRLYFHVVTMMTFVVEDIHDVTFTMSDNEVSFISLNTFHLPQF